MCKLCGGGDFVEVIWTEPESALVTHKDHTDESLIGCSNVIVALVDANFKSGTIVYADNLTPVYMKYNNTAPYVTSDSYTITIDSDVGKVTIGAINIGAIFTDGTKYKIIAWK